MPPETTLQPDRAEILKSLVEQTRRWSELDTPHWLEVRMLARDLSPLILKYRTDLMALEMAADDIIAANMKGRNAYTCRNPLQDNIGGAASDQDVLAAFHVFADCDDETAANNLLNFAGPKYTYAVTTGTVPYARPHAYWELTEPVTDMAAWEALQRAIAASLGSDRAVVNPSRIMRVAGTITWPDQKKRERGYISEICTMRLPDQYEPRRGPVPFDQLQRAFASAAPATAPTTPTDGFLTIDAGHQSIDRTAAQNAALSGEEWHNHVIRLVASYVSKGLSDQEIHALTQPLTLPGYTPEDTAREVQTAIDGARRKGWTPEAAVMPALQGPARPEGAAPEQQAENPLKQQAENPLINLVRPWKPIDPAAIPRTQFVYSDFYARGYTSLTVAPPKTGKSMLGLAEAIDAASGAGVLTGYARDPQTVTYINLEDDQDSLNARVMAFLDHHGMNQEDIAGRLHVVSAYDWTGFHIASGEEGTINDTLVGFIVDFIEQSCTDLTIIDPLQDATDSPETNEVFRRLGRTLRTVAGRTQSAIGLIHHTRKAAPGAALTIDDARGGSALRGTCRFNRILAPMTEDEGARAGVDNHRWFMRIADMESNLAPPSSDVNRWFEKVSVEIGNGAKIGAVAPWSWPDAFSGVTNEHATTIRGIIDRRDVPPRLDIRSNDWAGEIVCDVIGMNPTDKKDRQRAKEMIAAWIKSDVLRIADFHDPRAGRETKVVVAGANNPGAA